MLTPLRALAGLAILCSLSLLAVILSIDGNLPIAYLGLAGYTLGSIGIVALVCFDNLGELPPVLRLPRIQLPTPRLPKLPELPKGSRVLLLGLVAVGTFFFGPPLVRLVYPEFGGFAPDTINAYTLGAAQYFLALTMAYTGWRAIFPRLYDYAAETMEGKLLESITADLLAMMPPKSPLHAFAASFGKSYEALQAAISDAVVGEVERIKEFGIKLTPPNEGWIKIELDTACGKQTQVVGNNVAGILAGITNIANYHCLGLPSTNTSLAEVAERRKIATLQFSTRCARLVFSCLPFFIFFFAANAALTSALTAVPAAVPGL
jgi:hypothetical protein